MTPEPIRGREALMRVPAWSLSGGCRHKLVNLVMDYGDSTDELIVRGYNFVTSWKDDAKFNSMVVARFHLVRRDRRWKIKSNACRMQAPAGYDPANYPAGFPYPADQPTRWPPL